MSSLSRSVATRACRPLFGVVGLWLLSISELRADENPARVAPPTPINLHAPFDAALSTFLARNCHECHGAMRQESELRLDTASTDFAQPATFDQWETVLRRIEAGEMPPSDHRQPTTAEKSAAVAALRHRLADALRHASMVRPGRGPRRLNRVEYQNTVQQLLGIDLDLAGYLPEDGTTAGFDKVGRSLSISPVLVERYLEAADVALEEALVDKPVVPSTSKRYTLWDDAGIARRTFTKNGVWGENKDAVLVFYTNDKFFYVESFKAPARGNYRVRVSAYGTVIGEGARQTADPVVLALHGGDFKSSNRSSHLVNFFSTEWNKPQTFEAVDLIEAGHSFKVTMAGRPAWTYLIKEYSGPALAVQWIEIEGPLDDGAAPRRKKMLLGDVDPAQGTPADAERLLRQFATRAFRRPTAEADVAPYLALMQTQFAAGAGFLDALKTGMKAVLCAPEFLFVDDSSPTIDDYAIASRLSYFIWGGPPDDELSKAAAAGKLRNGDERRRQLQRLLADSRSTSFVHGFLDSWLDLKKIDFTTPDKELYPEFDEPLREAMLAETRTFFRTLLADDLSVLNVVDSDFAMLNERLARHYGIGGVKGDHFRKVALPRGSVRGGMLTQASVLKVTADGTVTSPVLRGVWLLDRIMGRPVPPPPPGVPGVEPDIRGATTIRAQLAKHRQSSSCSVCHRSIDPPGFALENFDPIGGWRDRYRILAGDAKQPLHVNGRPVKYVYGSDVEAGDRLPDGRRFGDVREFKRLLSAEPEPIVLGTAEKLLTYGVGREPDFADREELLAVVAKLRPTGYGLRSLLEAIVAGEAFVRR